MPSRPHHKAEGFPGQRIVVLPPDVVRRGRRHPVLRSLLPTDVGFFPKAAGHWRERAQGAAQAIFIYCVQGAGWVELAQRHMPVHAGDLLVVPPGEPHLYGADARRPWTIHWFHAIGEHLPALLAELQVTAERPVVYLGEDARLLALFEEVLHTLEQGYTPARLLYASQALAHLIAAMLWRRTHYWRHGPDASQKVAATIQFMKQHLDQPHSVASLAALANLSPSHYCALFKRTTGYAPIEYLTRMRVHRACQLLDTTSLSIKEIATQVGYADALYFSRLFRRVHGVPPTAYRETHKG